MPLALMTDYDRLKAFGRMLIYDQTPFLSEWYQINKVSANYGDHTGE